MELLSSSAWRVLSVEAETAEILCPGHGKGEAERAGHRGGTQEPAQACSQGLGKDNSIPKHGDRGGTAPEAQEPWDKSGF